LRTGAARSRSATARALRSPTLGASAGLEIQQLEFAIFGGGERVFELFAKHAFSSSRSRRIRCDQVGSATLNMMAITDIVTSNAAMA
jgi:hypothetical protein